MMTCSVCIVHKVHKVLKSITQKWGIQSSVCIVRKVLKVPKVCNLICIVVHSVAEYIEIQNEI
jgi:hypothetical protein